MQTQLVAFGGEKRLKMNNLLSIPMLFVFCLIWCVQDVNLQVPGVPALLDPLLGALTGKKADPVGPTYGANPTEGPKGTETTRKPEKDGTDSGSDDNPGKKNKKKGNGKGPLEIDIPVIVEDETTEVKLKRIKPGKLAPEPNCGRTYYMHPFAKPVFFSADDSVQDRKSSYCDWGFIGTEPCIPLLTCNIFELTAGNPADDDCDEYLEVYDGRKGFLKFCGRNGPMGISAHGALRDLYVRYTTEHRKGKPETDKQIKFNCTVSCSQRGDGIPLPNVYEPDVDDECFCGKKSERVVKDEESDGKEFPWLAALVRKNTRQPFCGGSLLNDRMILTAGHCMKGPFLNVDNVQVLLGAGILDPYPNLAPSASPRQDPKVYDRDHLTTLDAQNGSIRFELEEIIVHPLFVDQTRDFDAALLLLGSPLDFSTRRRVSPICLPKTGSFLRTFSNRTSIVAGWGQLGRDDSQSSTKVRRLTVEVYPPKSCKAIYGRRLNRRMMCAAPKSGTEDACVGDDGGPLITDDRPEVFYVIGTLTSGRSCSDNRKPSVFLRTTEIGQWIHYHSNVNQATWCSIPKPEKNSTTVT